MSDLLKRSHYLEVINSFAVQLLKFSTVDEIVWGVAKHAIAKLGFIDCVVYLFDENNEFLIQRAAHGPKNPIDFDIDNPIKLKVGQGICGHVAATGKPELISDTSSDARYQIDDASRLSEIAVPILSEGKVIGVIDSEHPEKDFYSEEDLQMLTTIAAMASSKIVETHIQEKLRNHQKELEKQVEERTQELTATIGKLEESNIEKENLLREITDSISYAKSIQKAILPSDKRVNECLQECFIIYKPKDIVAGDFYWLEPFKDSSGTEGILLAAADCTGHGVPGAMVSVICNNALNRAVREYKIFEPGKILDQCREIVIKEFEKSEVEVKDGMDIALVSLALNTHSHSVLKYAGAHNPLWIVRNGGTTVEEIKADKQPIGKFDSPQPYQTHKIQLNKGDVFYIFSDGYTDQFGGPKGKKYKAKAFKELLLSIQNLSMVEQKSAIDKTFENWKDKLDQVDDVCVIGVRI
ncbi:SpoIIE family protein phosphatase [Paracrocinitomix mangrovi]|uniref:GAF domain-containing SpoIIE family protein phosphatase n=1 Tax=Paracrocinitomix mangrovi TaxID=2862509 RepID=UPI001C8E664C|nr:GAF domain-containing SpoIIE family protein phosphatase [Paracrocinitomix mangrovi]UKN01097.1 SpoIIE family protein phosphatase [Paracrocinitomix mangrovi]